MVVFHCSYELSHTYTVYLVALMLPLLVEGRLPTIIQPQRASEVPLRYSTFILQCTATGDGSLIYYWERRISENHNWYTIHHAIDKTSFTASAGQYRCKVTNEAGSVVSPVYNVYGENLLIHVYTFVAT